MQFTNRTQLDSRRLEQMILQAIGAWPHDGLSVSIHYSRGAEFSGTCYYDEGRIRVNVGRRNRYPYPMQAAIARSQSNRRYWWRELYSVELVDAYQLVLFVCMHEFYHWLVRKARRNVRQKEARCDRFATAVMVDEYGATVRDSRGVPVARSTWDFQDLNGFVAAALRSRAPRRAAPGAAVRSTWASPVGAGKSGQQLLLFEP
ncbi:MAG TPA: hypothetical protein VMV94_10755 [Phycisphaerae bacterium]|nr:hypothetical protein [Phycisphaerae bacterium]